MDIRFMASVPITPAFPQYPRRPQAVGISRHSHVTIRSVPPSQAMVQFCGNPEGVPTQPIFKRYKFTPMVANTREEWSAAAIWATRIQEENQESTIRDFTTVLERRSDEELKEYSCVMMGITLLPQPFRWLAKAFVKRTLGPALVKQIRENPDEFAKSLAKGMAKDNSEQDNGLNQEVKLNFIRMKQRFQDNPRSALIVLKNEQNQIVGFSAMNPLQRSHDFHADIGDMHAIDEEKDQKHALLSNLFIHPTARGKGLGTALKRTMTEYARDTLGYDYVWAPAEEGGASLAINLKKLGYTPLSLEKHPPGFDEDEIQYMLDEYNIGNHVMCWLKTSELPNPDA